MVSFTSSYFSGTRLASSLPVRHVIVVFLFLDLLSSSVAWSQNLCSDIFEVVTTKSTSPHLAVQEALLSGRQIFRLQEDQDGFHIVMEVSGTGTDLGTLKTLSSETELYHWGPPGEQAELLKIGFLSQASIFERILGKDRGGGGFYVSLSPIDSVTFGPQLTVAIVQNPILELPKNIYTKILKFSEFQEMPLEKLELISKLRAQINFLLSNAGISTIEITPTWKVVLHEMAVTRLQVPSLEQTQLAIQRLLLPNANVLKLFNEKELPAPLKPLKNWLKQNFEQH